MSSNDTTLSYTSEFVRVNNYRSKYGLQHGALGHTEQQDIKGKSTFA